MPLNVSRIFVTAVFLAVASCAQHTEETPPTNPGNGDSGVIFEDRFDGQPDWWVTRARPAAGQDQVNYNTGAVPVGWTAARNDEAWNPYDNSGGTPSVPGSHPTIQITGENHHGPAGKAFTVWNEARVGFGDGWGADGQIAKRLDRDYPELYIRFDLLMDPGMQWTSSYQGAQIKVFRVQHTDEGAASYFRFFEAGTTAPIVIFDIGVGSWIGNTGSLGASHQTRCDPQNWNYVNYAGNSYKVLQNHAASDSILPTNSAYWQAVPYNASYPNWESGSSYYKSYYTCADNAGYGGTNSRFVTRDGVESPLFSETLGDGNWHRLAFRVKMNSANGVPDGIYQHWVDGILKVDKHDRAYLGPGATAGIGWNTITLGGNANNNYKHILNNIIWSAVNFNGSSYRCLQVHSSSASITPADSAYWVPISYNPNYPAWATGVSYSSGSYSPDAEQWYSIDNVVVSSKPIPHDYIVSSSPADRR